MTNNVNATQSVFELFENSCHADHLTPLEGIELSYSDEEAENDEEVAYDEDWSIEKSDEEDQGPAWEIHWLFEKDFQNQEEFNAFLAEENCWSQLQVTTQSRGKKTLYRCNKVKRRGLACSSGIYSLQNFAPNNTTIKLFRKNLDHNCEHSLNRITAVSDEVRSMIINEYESGNKKGAILFILRQNQDIIQPTKNQVQNVLDTYKKKRYGNSNITLTELQRFAEENKDVPEDDDEGFVVHFERSGPEENDKWFRIFYSTKRLLRTAALSTVIHADGTYKMIVQGYPVLVVGVSDYAKHFHLSGLAICSSESTADYEFLFRSLKMGVELVTTEAFNPKILVADAAPAITNGFKNVFGVDEMIRINCYAHLMMNVNKRKFQSLANKSKIKLDIDKLRFACNEHMFNVGSALFIEKWSELEPEFTMHFKNVYIENNNLWYAGAACRVPKTNNGLECFNRIMKSQQTHHQRKTFSEFKSSILIMVRERSKEYLLDKGAFQTTINIDDDTLLKGWQYAMSKKSMISVKSDDGKYVSFYVFAGDNMDKITNADVDNYDKRTYQDFDSFVVEAFSIYKIKFDQNAIIWQMAECTCPAFAKQYSCKHMAAVAFRLGILNPPDNLWAKAEAPIEAKRARGRPRKATPALVKD